MKVLVTGGAGYIGSVTTALLLEAGHTVTVLDNLSRGNREAIPAAARFIEGDVRDIAKLVRPADGIEAVVHLAAYIAAGESMSQPELYWQNNTVSTLALLEGLQQLGIPNLVFASTAAVYGNPEEIPITEDARTVPTNTYGQTKLAIDLAITSHCWTHELAATSVRFFNVAGAYGTYGERHRPHETHIIPLALEAAAGNRPFQLFGDDYPTADGTCVRDYIHVADLGRAIGLALAKNQPGRHAIYNLGNGHGFSNKQVMEAIQRVTGKPLRYSVEPRRPGDPATLVASSARAQSELGWVPERPDLNDIIQDAWEFRQSRSENI